MVGDREAQCRHKIFTKEHVNAKTAKMKKEISCELKLFKEFLQSKLKERFKIF